MQVTESVNEGLKRELKIVVPAAELESRLSGRLDEIKSQVRLNGFRPGKVPVSFLRKTYGRSVMAEVVQQAVTETSQQALDERAERPAFQPEIEFTEDKEENENVMAGTADLAYTRAFEVIPPVEVMDLSTLELERLTCEIADKDIDDALSRVAANQREFAEKDGKAETGDRVTIDFVGKIDGEAFDGGKAEDAPLELGSNTFIPGFEDQLVGTKAGDENEVTVTFPEDYGVDTLAGKEAVFDVKVKQVAAPAEVVIDDELAKRLGLESLDKLKEAVKSQIASEYAQVGAAKLKRQLLDALDEAHSFALPEKLVDQEFDQVWHQVTHEMEHAKRTFEDEGTTEEDARKEYRQIAERRVRLGLLLGAIGERNEITVTDDEMNRALIERVRQFPGQEREVYDYYQKNPQALAELRAPAFEQKVVDYITELAKVTERAVDRDELYADPDEDGHEHHDHDHDHDHSHDAKPKAKKPAAKKKAAKAKPEE
jgi:trigger factor